MSTMTLNISETVRDRSLVPRVPTGNGMWDIKWSRDRWRRLTLKGQTHDANTLGAQYLENGCRQTLRSKGPPIANDIWGIKSRDVTGHVTRKVLWDSTVGYPSDSLASCYTSDGRVHTCPCTQLTNALVSLCSVNSRHFLIDLLLITVFQFRNI